MTSKVSIVNKALSLIGASRITSLDDDTLEAKAAQNTYEQSLRSILSECLWNFATKRSLLSEVVKTAEWTTDNMNYYFQLPSGLIRVFETSNPLAKMRIEGEYILTNYSSVGILYTYYLDEPSKYPASFVDALSYKLAADMCYEITNSNNFAGELLKVYEGHYLPRARTQDAQTGTHNEPLDSDWVNARFGGICG